LYLLTTIFSEERMKRLILIISIMALPLPAFAQWEYGGKVIGMYSGITDPLAVANLGEGRTVVAWNGIDGINNAIYATCIDSAGYPLWGDMGMIVYEDSNYLEYPAALNDGHGGAFVVWGDWRHTWAQGICLYGQHLDSLGNKLWPEQGKRLTADTMSQSQAHLYDDEHGGFIAVYENLHGRSDIGAQRVDADGNILWDSTGIFLTTAEYDQNHPKICMVSNNAFVTIWLDDRFIFNPDSAFYGLDIYMQKFNIYGQILWAQNGIPVVHTSRNQGYGDRDQPIVSDGHGGFMAVWIDGRNMGYNDILYADRFSPTGQSLWQYAGEPLYDPRDDLIARGCRAFRLDSTDSFMIHWNANTTYRQDSFWFTHLDINGYFEGDTLTVLDTVAVWNSFMDPEGVFKYFTAYDDSLGRLRYIGRKCDMMGNQYWGQLPFISGNILSETEELRTDNYGGMIIAWLGSSNRIAISRIYANGYVGGDTTNIIVNPDNSLPANFRILQNFPNPFNASTEINYSLPQNADIRISIYNLLGQKVVILFDGKQNAGEHSIKWDAVDFPSGVYFARLESGGKAENIKMVLLK
jgi:hypothetical protein